MIKDKQDKKFNKLVDLCLKPKNHNKFNKITGRIGNTYKQVENLLDEGIDVNQASNTKFYTPLTASIKSDRYNIAELLLSKNANVNKMDIFLHSPLTTAIINKNFAITQLLINYGAKIKEIDLNHIENTKNIKDLINKESLKQEEKSKQEIEAAGQKMLNQTHGSNSPSIPSHHIDKEDKSLNDYTLNSTNNEQPYITRSPLSTAKPSLRRPMSLPHKPTTPLHQLFQNCKKGEIEKVKNLLDNNTELDINQKIFFQKGDIQHSAIDIAAMYKNQEIYDLLIEKGAKPGIFAKTNITNASKKENSFTDLVTNSETKQEKTKNI